MGIVLTGQAEPCVYCSIAKAKQKGVPKQTDPDRKTYKPAEKLSFDLSSVKTKSLGGSKFWLLIIDDATDMCWSKFLKKKSDLCDTMMTFLHHLKTKGFEVKYLKCNDAGENQVFEQLLKK